MATLKKFRKPLCWSAVIFFLLFGLPCFTPSATAGPNSKHVMFDTPLTLRLKQKGFTCEGRLEGNICVIPKVLGEAFSYPEPIAFVLPRHAQSPFQPILYLHGHRGVCEQADLDPIAFVDRYRILQQITQPGLNPMVLVLPFSKGKSETYAKFLQGKMAAFINWVQSQLATKKSTEWIIAGHSGAGKWIGYFLEEAPPLANATKAVFLLDATYAVKNQVPRWRKILEQNPKLKIFSVVVPKTETAKESSFLMNSLPKLQVQQLLVAGQDHCTLPTSQLLPLLRLVP